MDNVCSDTLSSHLTNPFTVNEELSFEDALVEMAKMVADRAVECLQPR